MLGSYEKINYSLRPAKNIERKMMGEAFRRLSKLASLSSYRYIGFGSTFFSDFSLYHKSLGLTNMVSIEKDEDKRDRFIFNRPYHCITMEFGHSNNVLPGLPWDCRTIAWLDYDGELDNSVLTDINFVCTSAPSGSVLVVSVNAEPGDPNEDRLDKLRERVGENKLPADIDERNLPAWGTANVYRRIITNEIQEVLNIRNGVLSPGNKMLFKQLFYFLYSDGARMVTIGGLIYDEGLKASVNACEFDELSFIRTENTAYKIDVPSLTYKEMRYLDTQLPVEDPTMLSSYNIPSSHLQMYARIYKWFPNFAEAEF